eukprot:TRINITY_DN63091_c0_g1_i1.p1 TRINITY_DN63091_c0_g1~~TRINITY_DN63091_c0_g1_i1.p1  ORF type:complete len:861 (-),score=119.99 TRINITY_DN63091_c0_g1_i1:1799-4381(-)
MKESAPAALPLPVESPEERKRRLARERQRRHREKLRANKQRASDPTAATSSTSPSNAEPIHTSYPSNSIGRPSPRSSSAHNHHPADPPHSSNQHASTSLHSSPPHPSISAPLPRHNTPPVHVPAVDPPKPLVDTTNAAASRLDASVPPSNHPSPPSVYGAKHAHSLSNHDHRTASHLHQQKLQPQYNHTQPLHHSLQPPHQSHQHSSHIVSSAPRPVGHHLLHQPSQHHLTEPQQPNHQVRRMHQVHHTHPQSSHHTSKPPPVVPASLAQQTQQASLKHPHHSQLQRPYSANVHLHPQPFSHVSHAFPAHSIPPHPPQSHANQADNPFNFQTTTNDQTLQQHAYVTDAPRSYLNDLPPRDQHQYTRYHSPSLRHAPQHADASPAITAITQSTPPAVNGVHPSLPNSSTQPNLPSTTARIPSSLHRNVTPNRFSQTPASTQTLTPPLQSQVTHNQAPAARDSNQGSLQARNPNETAEERKRRLARERQRRRRKRLKLDPQANPNKSHVDTSLRVEESHREIGSTSQDAHIDINMHVRQAADNPMQMPSSAVQPALHTPFESSNLATNNHSSSLQTLQVAPVTAAHEEIHVSNNSGRNAYNPHSLTMGTGPNVSNGLSTSHRAAADLARMSGAPDERIMRPNEPEEDPESRKRRLARERQRRRRQRLKEKRFVETDKAHGSQSQSLKYEPTQPRVVDSMEARNHSELDRRTIPTDPIPDTVRMPLTAPPANVFGPRNDVTSNMPFEQQNRLVRNSGTSGVQESTVPPMTLNFNGNNGINLGAMPLNNVMGSQNLVHWSQGFESENAARFAVETAVGAFRAHLGNGNPSAKAYVLQQGIMILLAEEGGRELITGQMLASMRAL